MKKIVIAALLLAGCAATPMELREQGVRSESELKLAPSQAANCAAKNIENAGNAWTGHHIPTVRQGDAPGTFQLAIIGVLVADFVPHGTGSTVTIWEASQVIGSIRERYVKAIQAC